MKKIFVLVFMFCSYIANAQIEPKDTDGDGYRNVSTLDHLRWISENTSGWALNYKLENDINAADTKNWNDGKGWSPIGDTTKHYNGIFDGQGFKIESLFINRPLQSYIGFFGYTSDTVEMKNLGISNCDITGKSWIGGLVGLNYGKVKLCYSSGSIVGMDSGIGGILGLNYSNFVTCSYSTASTVGKSYIGGFAGYNTGTISNSYARGDVNGSESLIGGFVGENNGDGMMNLCYSTGRVTGIAKVGGFLGKDYGYMAFNCFWDKETCGQDTSARGIGKTTQEMKTKSTFTDLGWNLISIWNIDASINNGYPYIDIRTIGKEPKDTDSDGYLNISCYLHLIWIGENPSSWSSNFELDNDISADSSSYIGTLLQYKPIGTSSNAFNGIFDGHGYNIDNLHITLPKKDSVGFIGVTTKGAFIKNLGITNCEILGSRQVGSLVGYNNLGNVNNCYSTGVVNGSSAVGGLIGINIFGPVRNSYSISKVSGGYGTGGLVGYNQGTIQCCYSEGSVNGGTYTGGLTGFAGYLASVSDCYSISEVWGSIQYTGGLIGFSELTTIKRCYSIGKVTGTGKDIGGLVGKVSQGSAENCFWDIETSGTEKSGGGRGKSTENMKTKSTFTDVGWNFFKIWNIDSTVNNGYPYLDIRTKPKITIQPMDTDSNGYLNIKYFAHLLWVSENSDSWTSNFELDNDISADSLYYFEIFTGLTPIGNKVSQFSGKFDGKGHTIDSIIIPSNGKSYLGLFGYTSPSAEIYNLGVTNCNISGKNDVGGMVGCNQGTFINCFATGSVRGSEFNAGGFVGSNFGRITNCYSRCGVKVIGSNTGGFVGDNNSGTIINSYCTGSSTNENPGSIFVGSSKYGIIIFSFFDIGPSGTSHAFGGIPKITAEMKTKSTFTDAGWDFVNIWNMDTLINDGYPYLNVKSITKISKPPLDTDSDGFLNITCLAHLAWLSENPSSWSSNFELDNDISADSSNYWQGLNGFTPIGKEKTPFSGIFDGKGYNIANLYINCFGQSNVGLFGYTAPSSKIRNLSISNSQITGNEYIGALVGYSDGLVSNCYSTGKVVGQKVIGGLVGFNNTNSNLYNCYSRCVINGTGSDIGGLVGKNNSGNVTNCFWDIEKSGATTSSGGTGKTTNEMHQKGTFTDAGWDFEKIWGLDLLINQGYPFLIEQTTGINETEPEISQISISPNPASDLITISLQSSEDSDISIYNTLGEIVLSVGAENFLPTQIDISALPKGMYFLKIGDKMAKFVKM